MFNILLLGYLSILLFSILLLCFASDRAVKYSVKIAKLFKVNKLFVGFALMAVATGIPELSIAISSVFRNAVQIATGTIIGSNVSDVSLVLGLPIIIFNSITIKKGERKNLLIMLIITFFAMTQVFSLGQIGKLEGAFLIALYVFGMLWMFKNRKEEEIEQEVKRIERKIKPEPEEKKLFFETKLGLFLKLFFALGLLLVASELSVHFAVKLSKIFAYSLEVIGATIFAIGTSLPELSLSMSAIRRKEFSLALGNSLGSVLEQGTLILGILALISGNSINLVSLRKLAPFMLLSYLVLGFGIVKLKRLNRWIGGILLLLFVAYLVYFIFMG